MVCLQPFAAQAVIKHFAARRMGADGSQGVDVEGALGARLVRADLTDPLQHLNRLAFLLQPGEEAFTAKECANYFAAAGYDAE